MARSDRGTLLASRSGRCFVGHFWAGESAGTQDPGEDPHGAPDPAPLWIILDLTPGGRGTDWYPKLEYAR